MSEPHFIEGIDRVLADFATRNLAMAEDAADDNWEHGGYSISAIILSAAAVEAHIGEWLAENGSSVGISDEIHNTWVKHHSVSEIIKEIFDHLGGPSVGSLSWYDGLLALTTLRNHVVHYYPKTRSPGTWPDKLEPYVTNGFLEPDGDDSMDWTSRVFTSSVAGQAFALAMDTIEGFQHSVSNASG